jgi:hypothetical protein
MRSSDTEGTNFHGSQDVENPPYGQFAQTDPKLDGAKEANNKTPHIDATIGAGAFI